MNTPEQVEFVASDLASGSTGSLNRTITEMAADTAAAMREHREQRPEQPERDQIAGAIWDERSSPAGPATGCCRSTAEGAIRV